MKIFKKVAVGFFLCFAAIPLRAEVSPISLTLFGLYGSPVYPPVLANIAPNAFGLNALVDWQATSYTSFGLGFEQTTFYQAPDLTIPLLNLEARVFPLENEKNSFSPYVYGGVGLNLSSTGGAEPIQLKAGLGSRIRFVGPLFFDFAAGSHWIQPPASFQYVDFRAGLSLSFGFKEPPQSTPTTSSQSVSKAAPVSTLASVSTPSTAPTSVVPTYSNWTASPVTVVAQGPTASPAEVRKYYRTGNLAFKKRNYPLALMSYKLFLKNKDVLKSATYNAIAYDRLGFIYQFHAKKVKDHNKKALENYRKALAINPKALSAKKHYKKLKAQVAKEAKKIKGVNPGIAPTPQDSRVGTVSTSDITISPDSTSGNVPAGKGN